MWVSNGRAILWSMVFKRRLRGSKADLAVELSNSLYSTPINPLVRDKIVQNQSSNQIFSIKSFYKALLPALEASFPM